VLLLEGLLAARVHLIQAPRMVDLVSLRELLENAHHLQIICLAFGNGKVIALT